MGNDKKDISKGTKTTKKRTAKAATTKKPSLTPAKSSAPVPKVFHVFGQITHRTTKKGLSGLRVEAIDNDPRYESARRQH